MEELLKSEINSIVDFVKSTWNVPSDERIEKLIEMSFVAGYEIGKKWTDGGLSILRAKSNERTSFLEIYMPELISKDRLNNELRCILSADITIQQLVKEGWDFYSYFKGVYKNVVDSVGLMNIHPILCKEISHRSYSEAVYEHIDYDDYGYSESAGGSRSRSSCEQNSFTGMKIGRGEFSLFVERIAMHSILHRNSNGKEETPFYQLISELVTHGIEFGQFNNIKNIEDEIRAIDISSCSLRSQIVSDNKYISLSLDSFYEWNEFDCASDSEEETARKITLPESNKDLMDAITNKTIERESECLNSILNLRV